jgi:lipopolysaccharide transport system ATP-binding protein
MPEIAVSVKNLNKSFMIGHHSPKSGKYISLRDELTQGARNITRKTRDLLAGREIVQGDLIEQFFALKDISFDIKSGDRVGIIGKNGAGKSTLLKILSRITEPTRGSIRMRGRVASLLEVGTGFHPELTGRENIFLNGAILGMSRKEIVKKFDAIVDFSEVENFLDTPVKRYSSGMYVRLAFAVAAHLEPEILIVDEVLSVGDVDFQKKCLARMGDLGNEGRTLIFVSHNMSALQNLCDTGILLEKGSLKSIGPTAELIQEYLQNMQTNLSGSDNVKVGNSLTIEYFNADTNACVVGEDLTLNLKFLASDNERIFDLVILFYNQFGQRVGILDIRDVNGSYSINKNENLNLNINISSLCLVEGEYKIGLFIKTKSFDGDLLDLLSLTIMDKKRLLPPYDVRHRGFVEMNATFTSHAS